MPSAPREPNTLSGWANLACCQTAQGRPVEAIPLLERTAEVFEETWGAPARDVQDDALAVLAACLDYCTAELGPAHPGRKPADCPAARWPGTKRPHSGCQTRMRSARPASNETRFADSSWWCKPKPGIRSPRSLRCASWSRSGQGWGSAWRPFSWRLGKPPRQPTCSARSWAKSEAETRCSCAVPSREPAWRAAIRTKPSTPRGPCWPAGHPVILGLRATLARVAARRDDRAAAATELESVVSGLKAVLGEAHPRPGQAAGWLKEC